MKDSSKRLLNAYMKVFLVFVLLILCVSLYMEYFYTGKLARGWMFILLLIVFSMMTMAGMYVMMKHFDKDVTGLYDEIENEKVKYREMKQQMTSNIAHELRTPISSIRGYLETLSSRPDLDPERRNAFIERAYIQSIRLSDLVRDIGLIIKIEEASARVTKERVNFRQLFEEVIEEFRTEIDTKGINIEDMLPPDIAVYGNYTFIYAIFRNLVENSIKYAGEHVTIHLGYDGARDGLMYFKYYDTGKGVSREHLERIFERFYRLTEGRSRDDGGSGLGLSIVRNAIDFHGGDIIADRHHGGGLEYRFTFAE